ncbi:unnamed protein product, partial [marine sediment metagenome]
ILTSLSPETFHTPIVQQARSSAAEVYKLYYLKDHVIETPSSFDEMTEKLENDLIRDKISVHSSEYMEKLRKRYGYELDTLQRSIPENFEPFILK